QSRLGLPKSITGVFQGLLLFMLLACDTFIQYRLQGRGAVAAAADAGADASNAESAGAAVGAGEA
ncbi:MAG: ABC transporter permease, partial [Brachymonas sp.]